MYFTFFIVISLVVFSLDLYFYRAVKEYVKNYPLLSKKLVAYTYWFITALMLTTIAYMAYSFGLKMKPPKILRIYAFGIILMLTLSKLIGSLFLAINDLKWLIEKLRRKEKSLNTSRRNFLKTTAVFSAAIPFGTLLFGVVKSAFNFKVRNQKLKIKGLPSTFKGLKIVQLSDIHSGSFVSEEPLAQAVKLVNDQQPDIVFFTGDLVNDITEEALPFVNVLKQIEAPLGVFSILGNHDYGDYYYQKDDIEGKKHNYDLMKKVHAQMGWKLLLNENHVITKGDDRLAVLGVENWGHADRFPKHGDIDKAKKGCLETDVKLLLSHDPSHWEKEVIPKHKDIAVTFSGHTHGMQFGIEVPGFKWSPSKYLYKQWAGLYQHLDQQIYVNRGLGFIGYPGRVGILPEITVFELA